MRREEQLDGYERTIARQELEIKLLRDAIDRSNVALEEAIKTKEERDRLFLQYSRLVAALNRAWYSTDTPGEAFEKYSALKAYIFEGIIEPHPPRAEGDLAPPGNAAGDAASVSAPAGPVSHCYGMHCRYLTERRCICLCSMCAVSRKADR